MDVSFIKTAGDLEAVILHENVQAFASIINKDLYIVGGDAPDQNILFHNSSCFDLFCIHVFELLAERSINLSDGENKKSLFTGAKWLADKYQERFDVSMLLDSIKVLENWLNKKPKFSFWCGDIDKQIEFNLSRRKALRYAHLISKHNLLSVNEVISALYKKCVEYDIPIKESDVLHLLDPFVEELKDNRIIYHSSYLVEMLHDYFTALNELARQLYLRSPTNILDNFIYPKDITSDTFKNLYYSALSFSNGYNKDYYASLKPSTISGLKKRY